MSNLFKTVLILSVLFLVSCTTVRPTLIFESGRPVTDPFYVLRDTGNSGLQVTFWFTSYTTIKDVDDSVVYVPQNLDMNEKHTFSKEVKRATVSIEVYNPKRLTYKIDYGSPDVAKSNLMFREYVYNLPEDKNEFIGNVSLEDSPMFIIGPLQYWRNKQ